MKTQGIGLTIAALTMFVIGTTGCNHHQSRAIDSDGSIGIAAPAQDHHVQPTVVEGQPSHANAETIQPPAVAGQATPQPEAEVQPSTPTIPASPALPALPKARPLAPSSASPGVAKAVDGVVISGDVIKKVGSLHVIQQSSISNIALNTAYAALPPTVKSVVMNPDTHDITVQFSKKMDENSFFVPLTHPIQVFFGSFNNPLDMTMEPSQQPGQDDGSFFVLHLQDAASCDFHYTVKISPEVSDELGNKMGEEASVEIHGCQTTYVQNI